jgi:AcrR family transcriptional regulator
LDISQWYDTDLSVSVHASDPASSPARERILQTATELFYRDGYGAVGVDMIIARAGVAKTTLYRHFPSKDALIVAYLERSNERFWAWFEHAIADSPSPRAKLIALFEALASLATSPACLGCTFQGAAFEFPSQEHPGHLAARQHKQAVLDRLRELAREAGAPKPAALAGELLLIMDGAFAAARMFGASSPATAAPGAVAALLDAHLPASPDASGARGIESEAPES